MRGIRLPDGQSHLRSVRHGKSYVVAIGIDRYQAWGRLHNAVQDARGVAQAFERLGFESRMSPLLDQQATADALRRLVADDLRTLQQDDSLVLFFAGHGHNTVIEAGGARETTGYLIPCDGDQPGGRTSSWLRIDVWLNEVAKLPPRHILVILDACHSGLALPPVARFRGSSRHLPEQVERLRARRSRRVITSAHDDEQALDSGPVAGHSLFTGYLIKALAGEMEGITGFATGTEIGAYVQGKVMRYHGSRQTPDLGALALDDRGELVITLPGETLGDAGARLVPPVTDAKALERSAINAAPVAPPPPRLLTRLDRALDRHHAERGHGERLFSVLAGAPAAASVGWTAWAADRGWLTLVIDSESAEAALHDLLLQLPWLRAIPAARRYLASAAGIELASVEATLDAKTERDRVEWLKHVTRDDPRAQVSGWLISALRRATMKVPEPASAPVAPRELLQVLAELAPISVLLQHAAPTERWLRGAIDTAADLTSWLPGHAVALSAPTALLRDVLSSRRGDDIAMARQSALGVGEEAPRPDERALQEQQQRLQRLRHALVADERTRTCFERNVAMPIHERQRVTEVELVARAARLVVQCDDWHRVAAPAQRERDWLQDRWLLRAGFFVQRFTAEDLDQRLDAVVEEIAAGIADRSELDPFSLEI